MDCLKFCLDRKHFLNYSKRITYQYNSRGFRDYEWPDKMTDVIWCVGDSFTLGIGQPQDEAWPQLLEKRTGKRCLNLGEDGCSNDTMALRAQEICKLYNPALIIMMWSYFSRRRINGQNEQYDKNHFGMNKDIENFSKNFKIVNKLPTNIINLLIPDAIIDIDKCSKKDLDHILTESKFFNKRETKCILTFPQLDYARDSFHFDIKTSKYVCNIIEKRKIM
jgi:hypothetical protein